MARSYEVAGDEMRTTRIRAGQYLIEHMGETFRVTKKSYGWEPEWRCDDGEWAVMPWQSTLTEAKEKVRETAKGQAERKRNPPPPPKMMTTSAAKKYLCEDNFKAYRRLGGKRNQDEYERIAAMFIRHTFDIYIMGDCSHYPSRQAAIQGFQKWANTHAQGETAARIFRSLDSVNAYT